jgi:putative membrane protein
MIEYIIVIILGILFGIFTGLIPGIHINMIASILLVNSIFLLKYFDLISLCIFILSMSITHTFVDFIPSILFGVPNPDTALSVLPGHQMVIEGKAYLAIYLSCIGSLFGLFSSYLMILVFFLGLNSVYDKITPIIPYILAVVILILIFMEGGFNKKFWALIISLFSGGYGMLILNSKMISNPLLILFSGIFGVASIVYSLMDSNSKIPPQNFEKEIKYDKNFFKGISIGTICSSICSITPGIGNSQAAILASVFMHNLSSRLFIVVLSSINTINFILSIVTLYIIDRARNGSILAISQLIEIDFLTLILFIFVCSIVCIISFYITLFLGKNIINYISKVSIIKVNISILVFIFALIFMFEKYIGIVILLGSSFIGILCVLINVRRVHLMNVLLIPVIINLI